jgi:hypothetical protein
MVLFDLRHLQESGRACYDTYETFDSWGATLVTLVTLVM